MAEEENNEENNENNEENNNEEKGKLQEEEIEGQKYTIDKDGDYCVGKVKVLDSKKVPFHNRAAEWKRKASESETQFQKRVAKSQEEKGAVAGDEDEGHDDSDIDPKTGFTYGQKKAFEKQYGKKLEKADTENKGLIAGVMLDGQKNILKNEDEYKPFFKNKQYMEELDANLENLPLQAKLTPGIVKSAVHLVMGQHIKEIMASAQAKGKTTEREGREIISEIVLGPSAGSSAGKKVIITDEIKELADQSGMKIEDAAEVVEFRNAEKRKRETK